MAKAQPVWTLHGTADDLIPISETERVVRLLEAEGGHGIQYLYEDDRILTGY